MTPAWMFTARWGVRTRLTVVATSVTAASLVLAGLLLVLGARAALIGTLDDAARQRGAEVAGLVDSGRLPDPLPVTGAAVVQVLDGDLRVRSSSPGGDRLAPLLDGPQVAAVRGGSAVRLDGARVGSQDPLRVVGLRAGQGGTQTVLVASPLGEVERGVDVVRLAALIAVPALVLVVGLLVWRVSGSALRPVEQLRLGAAAVTASALGQASRLRTLPVPTPDDEVARLARTLNEMLARLDDASDRQRRFVADAAHELRSPLASLRTQLEVALTRPGREDWPAVAAGGLRDVERMAALVDDLLLLARLGATGSSGPAAVVDLGDVVRSRAGHARRVPVTVRVDGTCAVRADRRALEQVVDNLLDNAARHAASSVEVSVGTGCPRSNLIGAGAPSAKELGAKTPRAKEGQVVLEVVDDGPGIAEADRERVFERFTRLDVARDRDAGGSGLGLAIVRGVVEQAGGHVVAAGRRDGQPGGCLRVSLPPAAGPDTAGPGTAGPGTAGPGTAVAAPNA